MLCTICEIGLESCPFIEYPYRYWKKQIFYRSSALKGGHTSHQAGSGKAARQSSRQARQTQLAWAAAPLAGRPALSTDSRSLICR